MLSIFLGLQSFWVGVKPADGQRVFFANHQSHLDTLVIRFALPYRERLNTHPVAAADFWSHGLARWVATRLFGAILIERRHITRSNNPLLAIEEALSQGKSLIIFPEGTRGSGRELGAFKPGLYHMARLQPGLRFVPTYLHNLNRILPKGEILPVPLCAMVYFGPEIVMQPDEEKSAFVERCRQALVALRDRCCPVSS